MGHHFPAIQEKRNLIAQEDSFQNFMVISQRARQDRDISIAAASANMPQNLARTQRGLGFRVCAESDAQGGTPKSEIRNPKSEGLRFSPTLFQVRQDRIIREAGLAGFSPQNLHANIGPWQPLESFLALLERAGGHRPIRQP